MTANTDFIAALSYEYADVSIDAGFAEDNFDDNGYGVSAGTFYTLADDVDLFGISARYNF
ncbi:hypothetical protein [Alteromonas sp. MMG017]|uniref:hypothetical protein n=1 Tax=Alteromonas sp. MMG017 TaxID=2822692 RepID=UPI001FFDDFD0|nr:hypothetical protein [Alteromonas sp. MMG017]